MSNQTEDPLLEDESWEDYFHTLAGLSETGQTLLDFHDWLDESFAGRTFEEIRADVDPNPVLLGGVDESGDYQEMSSAKLYNELFGVAFENPTQAFAKAREGMTLDETVIVQETPFLDMVQTVERHSTAALERAVETALEWGTEFDRRGRSETTPSEYQGLAEDPARVVDVLGTFVEYGQELLPNYDERARFVWELDHTPRIYLNDRWPAIDPTTNGDDARDLWDTLRERLGIESIFTPGITGKGDADRRTRENYTIYSYRADSVGAHLTTLYTELWYGFDEDGVREPVEIALENVPNYLEDYRSHVEGEYVEPCTIDGIEIVNATQKRLRQAKEQIQRRKEDGLKTYPSFHLQTRAEYAVSELTLDEYRYSEWRCSTSGNVTSDTGSVATDLDLLRILKSLAPAICVLHRLDYRLDIDEDQLEIHNLR